MMQSMNTRYLICLLGISLLTCGCANRQDEEDMCPSDQRIGVSACLTAPIVTTRTAAVANPYQGTTPSVSNPLDASVWFSTTSGTYVAGGTANVLPRHTEVQFNSGGTVYPTGDVLLYPESGTVYCVGLYPYSASEWTNTNASGAASDTHASHAIDGSKDLMFAPQISGTKASPISSPLAFTHQLTWLKINVIAEDVSAVASWGNITNITVTSPYDRLTVDLSAGTASCNGSPTDIIAFEGSSALKITSQEFGSIFCSPATGYNIKVTTANAGTKNLGTVALKQLDGTTDVDAAYAKGQMFVITLDFKPFQTIDATCTLVAWDDVYQTIEGS